MLKFYFSFSYYLVLIKSVLQDIRSRKRNRGEASSSRARSDVPTQAPASTAAGGRLLAGDQPVEGSQPSGGPSRPSSGPASAAPGLVEGVCFTGIESSFPLLTPSGVQGSVLLPDFDQEIIFFPPETTHVSLETFELKIPLLFLPNLIFLKFRSLALRWRGT